ncbi:hypothetical protein KM043_003562 [Ampulex compressa]|nr:hypothetical protein KM043_003562 [Ampulex compressa]
MLFYRQKLRQGVNTLPARKPNAPKSAGYYNATADAALAYRAAGSRSFPPVSSSVCVGTTLVAFGAEPFGSDDPRGLHSSSRLAPGLSEPRPTRGYPRDTSIVRGRPTVPPDIARKWLE